MPKDSFGVIKKVDVVLTNDDVYKVKGDNLSVSSDKGFIIIWESKGEDELIKGMVPHSNILTITTEGEK